MNTISKDQIDMVVSLLIAIDEAGGSIKAFEKLSSMTLIEVINTLAQNNIRFVFEKK